MDIQKEKEAYLGELLERDVITQDEFRDLVFKPEINAFDSNYLSSRFIDKINFGWSAWQAKAQAVPEGSAIKDVINERQRQINQEFYSTKNDDEYKQNELLRAAVCYAENVVRRGWVFDSSFGPDVYQEEEVPDLWPWDLDFWKPKNPRRDLVRAAALIIAEIERIDRSTGANQ
ncbi:hypothetical protein [Acinetobacter radioresistens]|uniref:hypothetical protein n=1 Tax=Acinetobacter radioresistens TaxID=40216 RepID=UPI001D18441E|nr:hypothetical protein [Acinetobacter radioresistens]